LIRFQNIFAAPVPNYYIAIIIKYGLINTGCYIKTNNSIPGALIKDVFNYFKYNRRFYIKPGILFVLYFLIISLNADLNYLTKLYITLFTSTETQNEAGDLS